MKKRNIIKLVCICFLLGIHSARCAVNAEENTQIDMLRLYNPNSGEHFYTANEKEKDTLVKVGWIFEGVGWVAPETSNSPVFRLYNSKAGDHHYTMKKEEKDYLVSKGWTDEGIGWYSDDSAAIPVYREYNPYMKSCNHNYTTNIKEHEKLVSIGWKDEGIGWYGTVKQKPVPIQTPETSPTPSPASTPMPSATPEPTPVATPEIIPTPSPSASPEVPGDTDGDGYDDDNFGCGPYDSTYNYTGIGGEDVKVKNNYLYGKEEALAVGTDPKLAKMPCPGFKGKDGEYWNLWRAYYLEGLEDDYVDGELLVVRWFPKRYTYHYNLKLCDHEFRLDMEKEDYYFHEMQRLNIENERIDYMAWGAMPVTDSTGDYEENPNAYVVFWYAVPEGSAYYDVSLGKVVLPEKK